MNYCKTPFLIAILYCFIVTIANSHPHQLQPKPEAGNSTLQRRQVPGSDRLQLPNGPPKRIQRLYPSIRRKPSQEKAYEDLMQVRHKEIASGLLYGNKKPQGAPQKFCTKFGCDCTPPPNARCCAGYRFDKRSNKCRQLSG